MNQDISQSLKLPDDGMIIDGFSSDQEQYLKQEQIQEGKKQSNQQKIKQQVKIVLPPPQQIKTKQYSLIPDRITGWGIKTQQANPIPIIFSNRILDNLVNSIITKPNEKYSLVYLGPRYQNTFYAWRDKPFNFPYKHINLPKNIKYKKRPFLGQNPQIQNALYFDSIFQSGNLDVVFQMDSKQYDLFLRVDSNTRGHFNWFNFTVKNLKKGEKYKFNICNLERGYSLYARGMKPYMKSLKYKNSEWSQNGNNVTYQKRQNKVALYYGYQLKKQFNLSFEIETEIQNDEIQISYCVPYQYSKMLRLIQQLKLSCQKKNILKQETLCHSLGGLPLPILTITFSQKNQSIEQKQIKKKCIILCARVHPGQSNSSYMMQGFLKFICGQSNIAQNLRKYILFKIVPMMNPDGVILGNYRTGLSGKDFNRQYNNPDKEIFPEVYSFKKLVTENKMNYKNNLIMFLDLHGHSQKKNIFAYGPQFSLVDKYYYEARVFAKMLEKQNKVFRYHSCIFKVSQFKLSTARAILLKKINIPLTYTIQASNGFYHDRQILKSIPFLVHQWIKMGQSIGKAINQYIECVMSSQKNKQERQKQKNFAIKMKKQKFYIKNSKKSVQKKINSSISIVGTYQDAKIKKIYDQILKQQKQKPQDPISDDNISEGSSDKENQKDDLTNQQLKTLFNSIKNNNKLSKNKKKKYKGKKVDLFQLGQDQNDIDDKLQIQKPQKVQSESKLNFKNIKEDQFNDQVFIAKQGKFNKRTISPPKLIMSERRQKIIQQFKMPTTTPKIINYEFQKQKKFQMFQTLGLFPDLKSKTKSVLVSNQILFSPPKGNRSVIMSNINMSPHSTHSKKSSFIQTTQQLFSLNSYRRKAFQRKIEQLSIDKTQKIQINLKYIQKNNINFNKRDQIMRGKNKSGRINGKKAGDMNKIYL